MLSCRQAEAELALQVGGDLDDPAASLPLQAHLANCPDCREYQRRLTECLEALQTCAAESLPTSRTAGLWPRVAARLAASYAVRPTLAQFNVWMPTTAIAAACAVMVFVTIVQVERAAPNGVDRNYFHDPSFAEFRDSSFAPPANSLGPDGKNWSTPVGLERTQLRRRFPSRGEF